MQKIIDAIHSTAVKNGFWDDFFAETDKLEKALESAARLVEVTRDSDDPALQAGHDDAIKAYTDILGRKHRAEFNFFAKQMTMLHSEISELMEALRKSKGKIEVEMETADIFIRLVDLYEGLRRYGYADLEFEEIVYRKANKNVERERLHGVKG